MRRNDDSISVQALQWTLQGHRGMGWPKNTIKTDLEKEKGIAGFKNS